MPSMSAQLAAFGAAISLLGAIGPSPCKAQTRVTSVEALGHELAEGDIITVGLAGRQKIRGRLTRLGAADFDLRPLDTRTPPLHAGSRIRIALDDVTSLERRRDSTRNGVIAGAGVGAGVGGALFAYATAVDRNEIDEWAPFYLGIAAVTTGIGALVGWAIDAARSKPGIVFEAPPESSTRVSVRPICSRRGVALALTHSW